jgi:hypothetical protein
MVKIMFVRTETVYWPIELLRRVGISKWSFQQVCAALRILFCQAIDRNLSALVSTNEEMKLFALVSRDHYVQLAKEVLSRAFFTSLVALQALRDTIGKAGFILPYRSLAKFARQLTHKLWGAFARILTGPAAIYGTGVVQMQDRGTIIGKLGHVCAVLRLREMVRPFSEDPKVALHADVGIVNFLAAPKQKLIDNFSIFLPSSSQTHHGNCSTTTPSKATPTYRHCSSTYSSRARKTQGSRSPRTLLQTIVPAVARQHPQSQDTVRKAQKTVQ